MRHSPKLVGGILIGGRSSRMGGLPKGNILIANQTIIERTIELLNDVCSDIYLLGDSPAYAHLKVTMLPDEIVGGGPLCGIASLLNHVKRDVVVVACDLPNLNTVTLTRLTNEPRNVPLACSTLRRRHPLISCWRYADVEIVEKGAREGASVHSVFQALGGRWIKFENEEVFKNLNTSEELRGYQESGGLLSQDI